jgi:predicted CxxxxCH...CXXCH cytochrome family protein
MTQMRSKNVWRIAGLCSLLLVFGTGCANLDNDVAVEPDIPLTFQTAVMPILQAKCIECHNTNVREGGYDASTLISMKGNGSDGEPVAIAGDPSSTLITKLESGHHAETADIQTIRNWVVNTHMALGEPSVHPHGYLDPNSSDFHGAELRSLNYDWSGCQGCHGEDLKGGDVNNSCYTCHTFPLEGCETCHGSADRPGGAPPKSLSGDTENTTLGVGGHIGCMGVGTYTTNGVPCEGCHKVPDDMWSEGHLDGDFIAEITFYNLAKPLNGGEAEWDRETATCNNTYCHGAFGTGNNAPVVWTEDITFVTCGSCHNLPPRADEKTRNGINHPQIDQCHLCHKAVVDEDLNIIDKAKHINGEIDMH